jgi:tetratricopeptide (TPR) repeat protein
MRIALVAGLLTSLASLALGAAPPKAVRGRPDRDSSDSALRKALLELNDLSGNDPMRGQLKELLDDEPQWTKKLLAAAYRMAKQKPQPFNQNAAFLLAMLAEHKKEVKISAHFYRLSAAQSMKLGSERGTALAYLGLIQTYLENQMFAQVEKACKEALAMEGDEFGDLELARPAILRNMVTAIARQGDPDRALKLVDEMIKADPRNWLHQSLKGRILRVAERHEEAAGVYRDVIKQVEKETRLKEEVRNAYVDDFRYALSGVYAELGQAEKAAEQLKLLLKREPDNPTYNNDLGFNWADSGVNLPQAEKLIRKAIEEDRKQRKASPQYDAKADRDSAAFLDSLGWVLYKRGKLKEAKAVLLEAVQDKDGQNVEIYDHLGEVHLALGEEAEAAAAWNKAVEVATASKRDQKRKAEIQKKIDKHAQKKD